MNLTINYDLLVFFYRMTFSEPPRHQLLVFWMKMLGPRFEFKKNLPGIVLPTNWPKGPCRNKENRGKTRRRTMQSKVDGDKIDIAHLAYNKALEAICKRHSLKALGKYFGYIAIHTTTLNWSLPYWSVSTCKTLRLCEERLKALGLTPSASPASTRPTPASVASKVTPMTPIGQSLVG